MKDFPYLYRNSRTEARRLKETREHEDSFRLNVSCARAIEQSIRDHFSEAEEGLAEGCAQSVLERYGFLRVDFVLANSLKQMGSPQRIGEEERQWLQETYVPPDGKYNRYFAVDTAASLLEAFIRQTKEAYQALGLFGPEHCVPGSDKQDYIGKVLAVSPNSLKESCWDPRNQLWLAESGFGCSPTSLGRAVFATCLGDGERARWDRSSFTGIVKEELLPDWAQEKLQELRGSQQKQISGPSIL